MNGPLLRGTERIAISLVLHKPDTGRKPAWEIRSIRLAISPLSSDLMLPTSECFQKKGTGSPGLGFAVCRVLCLRTLMGPIWFWAKKELRNYSFWQDTRNMTSFLVGLLGREAYSTHAVSARCWGSTEEMCMGFSFFFFGHMHFLKRHQYTDKNVQGTLWKMHLASFLFCWNMTSTIITIYWL